MKRRFSPLAPHRRAWLVEVEDPAGHLLAVLAANAGLEPLLYTLTTLRSAAPAYVLLPDGLSSATAILNGNRYGSVAESGDRLDRVLLRCTQCRAVFPVVAQELQRRRGPRPGRPYRLTLSASHSADAAQR